MELDPFYIIGISTRTINKEGGAEEDIPALWDRFSNENIIEQIPDILEPFIYSVYTEYEGDYLKPYTCVIGCRVKDLDAIPEGMIGIEIPGGQFKKFTAKGNINEGSILSCWQEIWKSDLPRKYTADFEVYGEKAQNPDHTRNGRAWRSA